MRWIIPKQSIPNLKIGDKACENRFLFLPMTLENKDGLMETRWLETVSIEYEWDEKVAFGEGGGSFYCCWVPKRWVDKNEAFKSAFPTRSQLESRRNSTSGRSRLRLKNNIVE